MKLRDAERENIFFRKGEMYEHIQKRRKEQQPFVGIEAG